MDTKPKIIIKEKTIGGVVRNIDKMGRLVIPNEYRKSLGITPESPLEMLLAEDSIIIYKSQNEE